jgi:hypothetical protein
VPEGTYTTNRQYSDALVSAPECGACHSIVNPPGYVLEVYDAIGASQTTDPLGGAIDPTADVTLAAGVVRTISSPAELMTEVLTIPEARRLYAEKWVTYATKRLPNASDACIVDRLTEKLSDDSYPIRSLFGDIAQAESFRLRAVAQ